LSNPVKPTQIGDNKTGLATSPLGFEIYRELEGRAALPDTEALMDMRLSYCREAEPVGTMPSPSLKGMVKSAVAAAKGESSAVLLDKLGERLAFERSGARLYDALAVKLRASHSHDPTISIAQIEEIRDDEARHAGILADAILTLGGDPTAVTPCADVVGVLGAGFTAVLTDPKTTLTQCLGTMLQAEMSDIAAWELLVDLTDQLGHSELAARFRAAADEEDRHEVLLRQWVRTAILGQADEQMDPDQTH
jgi:ferritin-like protein